VYDFFADAVAYDGVHRMKAILAMALISFIAAADVAFPQQRSAPQMQLAQADHEEMCAQVISCGTKDGKRKEYPTPCAAKDDGATDITPKTGATC
jgi:hypothetical protein